MEANNAELLEMIAQLQRENAWLKQDDAYGILTRKGLQLEFERRKDEAMYAVHIDLDYIHKLNEQFESYDPVDALIRASFSFRHDDLIVAGRWKSGDEVVFILRTNPEQFIARLDQQLAAHGLSATSAFVVIENGNLVEAVEKAIKIVYAKKKERNVTR